MKVVSMRPLRINVLFTAILVLMLVVIAVVLVWRQVTTVAPQGYTPVGPGHVYLALGDSLAWGAVLEDPLTQSYTARIHSRLATITSIELVNLAVPGATSTSLLQRQLPQALARIAAEQATGRRVSPIRLGIGGNDLQYIADGTVAERQAVLAAFQGNLAQILDQLQRATGGTSDIAVMTYYNPYGGQVDDEYSEAYWVTRLNAIITDEATQRAIAVADMYEPFSGGNIYTYTHILVGDVHANAQGHAVIATRFWTALAYE